GAVLDDPAARDLRSTDFGRTVKRSPAVVVRPASTADVAAVVRYARGRSLPIATWGEGHSQSGQCLTDGGILLEMGALDQVLSIDDTALHADCQAGLKWESLVRRTIPAGLVPPVLTNNLGVTIGGTVSVGGTGVASFRHGTQADNLLEIEAVTGGGDTIVCSETVNPGAWNALRAGLGQFGVITRLRLKLRRCRPRVRTYFLLYDDPGALLRDSRQAIETDRFDYLESWAAPCPQGFRWIGSIKEAFAAWFFPLHATVEFEAGSPPDDAALLAGLSPYRRLHVEDQDLLQFASRLEPLFTLWKRGGFWSLPHLWTETVLPWAPAEPFIAQVLANLPPTTLVGGHVLIWPCRGTVSKVPMFVTPPAPMVVGFGVLPAVPPDLLPQAKARLNQLSELSIAAGGKRYLSGFIEFDRKRWKQHFGDRWDEVCRLKKTFDPDSILNPGFIDYGA
ncbi:MAG TPA: FAD-binding protein, partial [Candidatus Polarisedimenticolia bacterium]|nr:FAD-binding protein [Candidatus Polarisedimenticolia bacterium]